jgi:hypothetical protein
MFFQKTYAKPTKYIRGFACYKILILRDFCFQRREDLLIVGVVGGGVLYALPHKKGLI